MACLVIFAVIAVAGFSSAGVNDPDSVALPGAIAITATIPEP